MGGKQAARPRDGLKDVEDLARSLNAKIIGRMDGQNTYLLQFLDDLATQSARQQLAGKIVAELARQVGAELGEPDGVLVFDPSAFPKQGTESVGVQRQWCGRLGEVDNCQVGVYLGYVTQKEHALVDFRLYLPKQWATDRKRRNKAGVPKAARFRTRHELALQMLDERGGRLPHAWVAGDDERGRSSWFRQQLRQRGEQYLLAVRLRRTTRPGPSDIRPRLWAS